LSRSEAFALVKAAGTKFLKIKGGSGADQILGAIKASVLTVDEGPKPVVNIN
jgi:hypothetical protein